MTARPRKCDLETAAAQCVGGDVIGRGAVEHHKRADSLNPSRLLADMPDPAEISFALFPDVGDEKQPAPDIGAPLRRLNGFGYGQQSRETGAVVRYTGTTQIAFAIDRDIVLRSRRHYRIEMGRKSDQRTRRVLQQSCQHIPRLIDMDMPADVAQLRRHPFGAFLLEKSGRGHAAKLHVDIVHPLLFTREPLHRLAYTRAFGNIAGRRGRGKKRDGRRVRGARKRKISSHSTSLRYSQQPYRQSEDYSL